MYMRFLLIFSAILLFYSCVPYSAYQVRAKEYNRLILALDSVNAIYKNQIAFKNQLHDNIYKIHRKISYEKK